MKKLPIPLNDKSVKEIFLDCIANLKDKTALEQCADIVQDDSTAYENLAPLHLTEFHYHTTFPGGVTGTRLKDIYSNTFVRRKQFYNKILRPDGLMECPICNSGELSTLDHYLPKSEVPTLAVTPSNLVPMCSDCNRIKNDRIETLPCKMPFHLYFEDFTEQPWLTVNLILGDELAALYKVDYTGIDTVQKNRIDNHLELYELAERFRDKASSEMSRNRTVWFGLLTAMGQEIFRTYLHQTRIGLEAYDINSWQAALYRALDENSDTLIKWLNSSTPTNIL